MTGSEVFFLMAHNIKQFLWVAFNTLLSYSELVISMESCYMEWLAFDTC